jgi:putative DNA primase/helicase
MSKASKELDERLNKLRKRAAWWAKQHLENVADCEPDFPAEFDERQCDNSEALLAIAHVLGDPWPERIKAALRNVFSSIAADDSSTGVLLLGHIRKIFFDKDEVRLYTKDLIDALYAIPEAPWKHWNNGKDRTPGLTDRALAKMLKEYEVESTTVRIPRVKPLKGYKLEDFNDTFQRLLPPVCKCRIGDWECDCHEACKGDCSPPESNARDEGTARKAVN